jgi:hypothetical protein
VSVSVRVGQVGRRSSQPVPPLVGDSGRGWAYRGLSVAISGQVTTRLPGARGANTGRAPLTRVLLALEWKSVEFG